MEEGRKGEREKREKKRGWEGERERGRNGEINSKNRVRKKLQTLTERIINDLLKISFHSFNDTDVGYDCPVF